MSNYLVATIKTWNIEQFKQRTPNFAGNWSLITENSELTLTNLRKISPRYIFFPHWSWLVPEEILNEFECICFHMTDVPYGRGGSPLQNLISRGHQETKLSALKMEKSLDTGPVYMKVPLSLNGSANDIFHDCAKLSFSMMSSIIDLQPIPSPQVGTVVEFQRKKPADSKLPQNAELQTLYNTIRMLDADTYPKAFIDYGNFKFEFNQATLTSETELVAQVKITKRDESSS